MQHTIDSREAGSRRMGPIVCVVSALCAGVPAMAAEERVLVEDGKARYAMVVPDQPVTLRYPAGETLGYAAGFLNQYLAKTCGATLPVIQEGASGDRPRRAHLNPTNFVRRHVGDLSVGSPRGRVRPI